ncbi:MAG: hypothetical protein EXR79_06920 [Myxococcales bacterium]|nr:hypothetical protein [Myxococcales bacterium]
MVALTPGVCAWAQPAPIVPPPPVPLPLSATATLPTLMPLAGGAAAAMADAPAPVQVSARLSNPNPTFGERVTLRVELTHPADVRVFFPGRPNLKPFLVDPTEVGTSERREAGAAVVETYTLPLHAARLGVMKTPKIEVPWHRVTAAGGAGESGTVVVPSLKATVRSQFVSETEVEPAPLPAPRALTEENTPLEIALLVLATMVVAAVLTLVGLRLYRSRAAGRQAQPVVAPHIVAFGRLEALLRSGGLDSGEPRDVLGELSEILREYLGGRYRLLALDMTSTELLAHLEQVDLRGVAMTELRDFAETSDLVKFARMPASGDEMRALHGVVRSVVDRTMQTAEELDRLRHAEVARLARQRRLRLQVMAPAPLRVRALAIDVALGAAAAGLLAWVAIDTQKRALFDAAGGLLFVWLAMRDAVGGGSPGKVLTGLQIAEFEDAVAPASGANGPGLPALPPDGFALAHELEGAPTAQMAPWSARLRRNLLLAVPGAGLVAEALTALALPEQRRLGDQWAGTRVVDARHGLRSGKPSWAPAVVLALFALGCLVVPWVLGGRPQ